MDFVAITFLWCVMAAIGWRIGQRRGRSAAGAVWGFLLGPFGWLLVWFGPDRRLGAMSTDCPHCGRVIPKMQPVCNHCRNRVTWVGGGRAMRPSRAAGADSLTPSIVEPSAVSNPLACPKCGHERKSHETTPLSQCSNCGLVFARYKPATTDRSLSTRAKPLRVPGSGNALEAVIGVVLLMLLVAYFVGARRSEPVGAARTSDLAAVRYVVSGSAGRASLTYTNSQGGTSQEKVSLPWSIEYSMRPRDFMYISAQNERESGSVTVEIWVGGVRKKASTSSGAFVIASASDECC